MTYLAPRQGLFAIIVFISFCLHSLLLVINTDQQIHDSREQKGERMLTQLIDESVIALINEDRVSLGVIANRYNSETEVMHLEVRDAKGQVLVQVGDAPLHKGVTISRQISTDNTVIGDVAMVMKQTSKGEIFKMLWLFILGSLFLHILLWLAYGYIARPTKAQLTELSRDIHEHYRTYYSTAQVATSTTNSQIEDVGQVKEGETDIEEAIEESVEEKNTVGEDNLPVNTKMEAISSYSSSDTLATKNGKPEVADIADESVESSVYEVTVDIKFADENGMLAVVAEDYIAPYLELCTQLLQQAIKEVVNQPMVHGVYLKNDPVFTQEGSMVVLKIDSDYSKIGLAATMLAMLYQMLSQLIYEKHRELGRFALPIKIGIGYNKTESTLQQLLAQRVQQNEIAILLPKYLHNQINQHIQLTDFEQPTAVYEQECVFVVGSDDLMTTRLDNMRHAVLTAN